MRTKAGDKEKLRQEILQDSIQTFKKFGQSGAPVDQIMKKAGLTSGALYSHFKGKDDLFFQATQLDLENLIVRYKDMVGEKGKNGLKAIIDMYLSEGHLKHPELGCLFTSLGADFNRSANKKIKEEFGRRYQSLHDVYISAMDSGTPAEKKKKAHALSAILIGSMTLARMMPQEEALDILENARHEAYRITSIKV
jgi:TetR/AcrR family transcriptional repressor of nem operon